MKKLFFLIPTLEGGGAEKVLVDLVNNLPKDKYDITVKTILNGGVFEKKLNPHIKYNSVINVRNKFIRKLLFYILSFIFPAKIAHKIIVRNKYNIEVAYLEGAQTKTIAASRNKNSKKIAFIHTDFSNNYLLSKVYKTSNDCLNSYKSFDEVVFVSNNAKVGFEKKIGKLSTGLVLHNVLDENAIINSSKEFIHDIKPDKFHFVAVGSLTIQKGYDRLINAAVDLNKEKNNFEIWIIGEGDERRNLEELIIKENIKNIKLLGYKENPYPFIFLSDMLICASRVEGYSTVVSEALILQTPVITTDCAGMNEILNHGEFGKIVENSTNGIYMGMKEILCSTDEYNKCLKMAMKGSVSFSKAKNISKYEELFDEEY